LTFVAENLFGLPVFVKKSRLEGFEDSELGGLGGLDEGLEGFGGTPDPMIGKREPSQFGAAKRVRFF
jgi:hypothetical protein